MFGTVNPTASALLPGPILHRDEFLTGLHHVFSLIFFSLFYPLRESQRLVKQLPERARLFIAQHNYNVYHLVVTYRPSATQRVILTRT